MSKPHLGCWGCTSSDQMSARSLRLLQSTHMLGVGHAQEWGQALGCTLGFWERCLCVHPGTLVQHRQEMCQTASAGGCLQHVQEGTRNCLMINHCQPLFSLKTGLLDKAGNEALFWVCCYVSMQELELVCGPVQDTVPTLTSFNEFGWKCRYKSAC